MQHNQLLEVFGRIRIINTTVVTAKSESDAMYCLQNDKRFIIYRLLVY